MQDILLSLKQYRALISRLDEINDDVTEIKHQSHPEDRYIDNHDLSMILHITLRTLRRWRNSGKLPYKKLGHRFYYRSDCIMDVFKVKSVRMVNFEDVETVPKPVHKLIAPESLRTEQDANKQIVRRDEDLFRNRVDDLPF